MSRLCYRGGDSSMVIGTLLAEPVVVDTDLGRFAFSFWSTRRY